MQIFSLPHCSWRPLLVWREVRSLQRRRAYILLVAQIWTYSRTVRVKYPWLWNPDKNLFLYMFTSLQLGFSSLNTWSSHRVLIRRIRASARIRHERRRRSMFGDERILLAYLMIAVIESHAYRQSSTLPGSGGSLHPEWRSILMFLPMADNFVDELWWTGFIVLKGSFKLHFISPIGLDNCLGVVMLNNLVFLWKHKCCRGANMIQLTKI